MPAAVLKWGGMASRLGDLRSLAMMLILTLLTSAASAQATLDSESGSYITPFPEGDVYRLYVFGDSLSQGLHEALGTQMSDDARVRMSGGPVAIEALTSRNWDRGVLAIEGGNPPPPLHIAVVMLGLDDRASLRSGGRDRVGLESEAWDRGYAERVERVLRALKARGAAIYWVGLPVLNGERSSEHAQRINQIISERCLRVGAKFINIFQTFADETGQFNAYGPDLEGKVRRLRSKDGAHFLPAGNAKIAHFVKREIQRDLRQARSERTVELMGSPAELKRIAPTKTEKEDVGRSWTAIISGRADDEAKARDAVNAGLAAETVTVDLPSNASGLPESLKLKIYRPAVPQTILSLVTRQASAERGVQLGAEMAVSGPLESMALATVTPTTTGQITVVRKGATPTQMPYFKVWAKGERLQPRQHRADDVTWPRAHPVVLVELPKADQDVTSGGLVTRAVASPNDPFRWQQPGWDGPPIPARHPDR